MLSLNNVEVMFNKVILVLRGVSLHVPNHSIVALLGANGAGKTTTLNAITGLIKTELGEVTEGTIEFEGKSLTKMSTEKIAQNGLVQVMEGRRLFAHLTVEENLRVGARAKREKSSMKEDLDMIYSYFPRLKDLRHATAGYCSGGEQQMISIGRALMSHPKMMLLDEPSMGLSPLLVKEIFRIIKAIHDEKEAAILLVEQNAPQALDIADYGYVMENGRIVLDGTQKELKENEDVKEFYMGLSGVGKKKSYREVKHYRRRKRWL
jgi:branched-chain amino acid transport system ATP-binding protein